MYNTHIGKIVFIIDTNTINTIHVNNYRELFCWEDYENETHKRSVLLIPEPVH